MLNLAIRRRYVNGNLMLYRDIRWFLSLWLALVVASPIIWLLAAPPVSQWRLYVFMVVGLVAYFVLKHSAHGAILFNRRQRQIEVFDDPNSTAPKQTYLIDRLESVALREPRWRGRNAPYSSYRVSVILHFKGESESDGKKIDLRFSESESEAIARIIARFAKVPAFDWDGYQLWPEAEGEGEEEDEEEPDEQNDAEKTL